MDGIQAAVLQIKLRHLEKGNQLRRGHATHYDRVLNGIEEVTTPARAEGVRHVYHIYAIRVQEKEEVIRLLGEKGIGCGIHYPVPIHLQEAYRSLGYQGGTFPIAERSAKEFVCPYHQWTYDLDGTLLGLPFRRGYRGQGGMPADFRPEEHALQRLAVTQRHGVVFASFGAPNETLETYLGDRMLGYFDRVFDGRELVVLGYMRQRIPSNWKLMFENIKDPYHASLLHVFLVTFGLFRLDQQSAVEMDDAGRHAVLVSRKGAQETNEATAQMRAFKANFALRDKRLLDPVREFPGDATVVMQTLWPNLIVQQQSNTLAMRQIVPLDARSFDLAWTFFGYADDTPEMRQRRLRQANLMGPAGLVSLDDSEAMLLSQAGIDGNDAANCLVEMGGRGVANEAHMVTETAIRGFYQHYRSVMGL